MFPNALVEYCNQRFTARDIYYSRVASAKPFIGTNVFVCSVGITAELITKRDKRSRFVYIYARLNIYDKIAKRNMTWN